MQMHLLSFTSLPIHPSSGGLSPRKPPAPAQLQDGPQLQHHQRPGLEQMDLQETMLLSTHPGRQPGSDCGPRFRSVMASVLMVRSLKGL